MCQVYISISSNSMQCCCHLTFLYLSHDLITLHHCWFYFWLCIALLMEVQVECIALWDTELSSVVHCISSHLRLMNFKFQSQNCHSLCGIRLEGLATQTNTNLTFKTITGSLWMVSAANVMWHKLNFW